MAADVTIASPAEVVLPGPGTAEVITSIAINDVIFLDMDGGGGGTVPRPTSGFLYPRGDA